MRSDERKFTDSLTEELQDPAEAAHYLTAALADSPEVFWLALQDVAAARGDLALVSKLRDAVGSPSTLNPGGTYASRQQSLTAVLESLGLRLAVLPAADIVHAA